MPSLVPNNEHPYSMSDNYRNFFPLLTYYEQETASADLLQFQKFQVIRRNDLRKSFIRFIFYYTQLVFVSLVLLTPFLVLYRIFFASNNAYYRFFLYYFYDIFVMLVSWFHSLLMCYIVLYPYFMRHITNLSHSVSRTPAMLLQLQKTQMRSKRLILLCMFCLVSFWHVLVAFSLWALMFHDTHESIDSGDSASLSHVRNLLDRSGYLCTKVVDCNFTSIDDFLFWLLFPSLFGFLSVVTSFLALWLYYDFFTHARSEARSLSKTGRSGRGGRSGRSGRSVLKNKSSNSKSGRYSRYSRHNKKHSKHDKFDSEYVELPERIDQGAESAPPSMTTETEFGIDKSRNFGLTPEASIGSASDDTDDSGSYEPPSVGEVASDFEANWMSSGGRRKMSKNKKDFKRKRRNADKKRKIKVSYNPVDARVGDDLDDIDANHNNNNNNEEDLARVDEPNYWWLVYYVFLWYLYLFFCLGVMYVVGIVQVDFISGVWQGYYFVILIVVNLVMRFPLKKIAARLDQVRMHVCLHQVQLDAQRSGSSSVSFSKFGSSFDGVEEPRAPPMVSMELAVEYFVSFVYYRFYRELVALYFPSTAGEFVINVIPHFLVEFVLKICILHSGQFFELSGLISNFFRSVCRADSRVSSASVMNYIVNEPQVGVVRGVGGVSAKASAADEGQGKVSKGFCNFWWNWDDSNAKQYNLRCVLDMNVRCQVAFVSGVWSAVMLGIMYDTSKGAQIWGTTRMSNAQYYNAVAWILDCLAYAVVYVVYYKVWKMDCWKVFYVVFQFNRKLLILLLAAVTVYSCIFFQLFVN